MNKRTFSAEYKTSLVLEVLQGEQELNRIATNCNIAPNQLNNWKSEFMKKAVLVFDEKRDKKIINELQEKTEENERLLSTVAKLLGINPTSVYYQRKQESDIEITIKHRIDELHTENPTRGTRQLSKQLQVAGFAIGWRKIRRYMAEMAIRVIYPKPSLSAPEKEHKIYPYLLRNVNITRPNQAWSIDITYIRLEHGFVYLTGIIDWYRRCIIGWELDDALGGQYSYRALV